MTGPAWTKEELADLMTAGRGEVAELLTQSGGIEVEDVVAQSLEELFKAQTEGDVESPRELMKAIARRRALHIRDERERGSDRARIDDSAGDGLAGDRHGSGDEVGRDEGDARAAVEREALDRLVSDADFEGLRQAVSALAPDDRRIAELTYFGEELRTAPAVAGELGMEPGAVRARLVAIRRDLAAALEADAGSGPTPKLH